MNLPKRPDTPISSEKYKKKKKKKKKNKIKYIYIYPTIPYMYKQGFMSKSN